MNYRATLTCALALLAAPLATLAQAQDYPARPIRMIAPVAVGGATDIIVRAMGPKLTATLGESVVVDNQPGGGGIVGTVAAANAAPDGYTWLVASTGAFTANPHLKKQLPYSPSKDFAPVCRIGTGPYVLVVNPALGVKTLPELLARAKAETLSFASPGAGSAAHMAQEMFKARVGIAFLHVPYKGTGPDITDTVAGHTQVLFEAPGPLLAHIHGGKLLPLGITSGRRLASLPDVPTFEELGYKDLQMAGWIGLVAPKATPAPIVAKIAQACQATLAAPDLQSEAQNLGFQIDYAAPPEFAAFMESEYKKWGELISLSGLKPE